MLYIAESSHQVSPPFLSDNAYANARASLPFVATDAVITDRANKRIYLAWRQVTPAKGWWVIGGGVKNGQSPHAAMVKNFKRETTLEFGEDRFELLSQAVNMTQWTNDEQISNVHIPFKVELDEQERSRVEDYLDPSEYAQGKGLRSFTADELLGIIQEGTGYPQPVLYYDVLFGTAFFPRALRLWRELNAHS